MLYSGRLVPRKGVDRLIDTVRILHKANNTAELWVVGGKPNRRTRYEMSLRARAHGLPIRFFGFVSPTGWGGYYLAADVLACPSQKPEGQPLVILEGASTGLPIVAGMHSGIRECVHHENTGLLVRPTASPEPLLKPFKASSATRSERGVTACTLPIGSARGLLGP